MNRLEVINFAKKKGNDKLIIKIKNDNNKVEKVLYKNNPKLMSTAHLVKGIGLGTLAGHLLVGNRKSRLIGAALGAGSGIIGNKKRRIELGLDK